MQNSELLNILSERKQEYFDVLADKLDKLQAIENEGRGIDCVKALILYLRRGQIGAAKSTAFTEFDKFSFWTNICAVIKNELFETGEKTPWSS